MTEMISGRGRREEEVPVGEERAIESQSLRRRVEVGERVMTGRGGPEGEGEGELGGERWEMEVSTREAKVWGWRW